MSDESVQNHDAHAVAPSPYDVDEWVSNASPAAVVQVVDGWLLRWNHGLTRRANSVLASGDHGRVDLDAKIDVAEDFYGRRNARPRFQITSATAPALSLALDRRGYGFDAASLIQAARTDEILDRVQDAPAFDLELTETVTDAWLTLDDEGGVHPGTGAVRRAMLDRITPRTCYALARIDGVPASIALGVVERGWMGLYSVATLPAYRRRGASTAVLRALAGWARRHDAANMYLAVMEHNQAAQAVYARLGFQTVYSYHYREAPLG